VGFVVPVYVGATVAVKVTIWLVLVVLEGAALTVVVVPVAVTVSVVVPAVPAVKFELLGVNVAVTVTPAGVGTLVKT